jgi:hypothetical protein
MTKRGVPITVAEFIEQLKAEQQDLPLYFGGLDFYRFKNRGSLMQVEFNQTVSEDSKGVVTVENHLLPE